jgi:hypothetical protein
LIPRGKDPGCLLDRAAEHLGNQAGGLADLRFGRARYQFFSPIRHTTRTDRIDRRTRFWDGHRVMTRRERGAVGDARGLLHLSRVALGRALKRPLTFLAREAAVQRR